MMTTNIHLISLHSAIQLHAHRWTSIFTLMTNQEVEEVPLLQCEDGWDDDSMWALVVVFCSFASSSSICWDPVGRKEKEVQFLCCLKTAIQDVQQICDRPTRALPTRWVFFLYIRQFSYNHKANTNKTKTRAKHTQTKIGSDKCTMGKVRKEIVIMHSETVYKKVPVKHNTLNYFAWGSKQQQ